MRSIRTILLWTIVQFATIKSAKEVCYPVIGCFSLESPWDGIWRPVPKSPDGLDIQFYLITRNTQDKSIEDWKILTTPEYRPIFGNLNDLDYEKSRLKTVIQIYGYYQNDERKWNRIKAMADAYLSKEDANVIFVDWDANGHRRGYRECISNSRIVAAVAIKLIESLIENSGLTPDKIHIVGFSLGAHIGGYIGKSIPNIHRITALDAAQPGFENFDERVRLCHTDAQYVDAIHTNARPFFSSLGLGYVRPIGHVDFYFNGGGHQPGCWNPDDDRLAKYRIPFHPGRIMTILVYGLIRCSHHRSVEYWIEAVQNTNCTMWGLKRQRPRPLYWRRLSHMISSIPRLTSIQSRNPRTPDVQPNALPVGLDTFSRLSTGIFHVRTNAEKPFCIQMPQFEQLSLEDEPENSTSDPVEEHTESNIIELPH